MSGTSRRSKILDTRSPVVIAFMIDRGLLESWPFELTKRAMTIARSAPEQNMWHRLVVYGDYSMFTEGHGLVAQRESTPFASEGS